MREWVCNLQLLLFLASAVILRSESRGSHAHISLSPIRDSPKLEGQVPVFTVYPTGTGWSSYNPRHWFPFSSPPTTRRATVEVFDPASTRAQPLYSGLLKAQTGSPYIASARTQQRTPSPTILLVLCTFCCRHVLWLPWKCRYRAIAYRQTSSLFLKFRFWAYISQYFSIPI
jgi:hypothetical protein